MSNGSNQHSKAEDIIVNLVRFRLLRFFAPWGEPLFAGTDS
jgi:hypothetical protein